MDSNRFDRLVRALATKGSRRRLVAVLTALPLVGLLTGLRDDVGAEKPRDRIKRRKDANRRKQHNRKQRDRKHHGAGRNHGNRSGRGGAQPDACTPNGGACQQNSDCCDGNCFGQVCTNTPQQCDGVACPSGSTGCCSAAGCCQPPANQCNAGGLCCAPNCGGKQCGPDGCGNSGTCGTCAQGQTCNLATAQCEGPACTPASCPNGCCEPQANGPAVCRGGQRGCGASAVCCPGCCDGTGTCQPGTDGSACGVNGSACIQCDPLNNLCDQGRCQCDANNCPDGCCDRGPGNPGACFSGCGSGGVQCRSEIGEQCTQDGDCCSGNCFGGVCAATVTECGGVPCAGTANGCCGATCCDDAATCCGTGAICQNNQCVCDAQTCAGCCENGPGNPGRCLENAPPQCGIGGAPCQSCPAGCCDVGGSCQGGTTIENCATTTGVCQTCNDRLEVCAGQQCVLCEQNCACQGQSVCDGTSIAPNTHCGATRTGDPCFCMVRTNFQPVCIAAPFEVPCAETCVTDLDCQVCHGPLAMCVIGGTRCDLVPGNSINFCALPCET